MSVEVASFTWIYYTAFCQQLFESSLPVRCWKFVEYIWKKSQKQHAIHCLWVSELFEIRILPQRNFFMWNNLACGRASILLNWIQFTQKNTSGRKARMSATIGMKHTDHSRRGRRPLLSLWMRIMFLIVSSPMDCKMFLRRVAAISRDCRRLAWRRLRSTLLLWHRQRRGTETPSGSWE